MTLHSILMQMRRLSGGAKPRWLVLAEPADSHVEAYWAHLDAVAREEGRADWLAEKARDAETAAAWAGLDDPERQAVIDWCDDLDAQGRLEDHRFYRQWLALRMAGYVGD